MTRPGTSAGRAAPRRRPARSGTYRDEAGDLRLRARDVALQPETSLRCTDGHALRAPAHALRESIVRCHARRSDGQGCCALHYVVREFTHRNGSDRALVVHVTADEVQRLRPLTEAARLRYLGIDAQAITA